MGVRMRVHDGEPIGKALRRFKKLLQVSGVSWAMYAKPSHFVPGTQYRRRKRFRKRFKARQATLFAQMAGEQPSPSIEQAQAEFWKRTGKP